MYVCIMKYIITSKEFGRGPGHRHRFSSLKAASEFIQGRWQGIEYKDSESSFHSDYCTYQLKGFIFDDIGKTVFEEPGDVWSATFVFNDPVKSAS